MSRTIFHSEKWDCGSHLSGMEYKGPAAGCSNLIVWQDILVDECLINMHWLDHQRSKYYIHFWCLMCTFWNIKKTAKYNYASSKSPPSWSGKTVTQQLSKQRYHISTAADIFSGFCIFYQGFNTTPRLPESWTKKFHKLGWICLLIAIYLPTPALHWSRFGTQKHLQFMELFLLLNSMQLTDGAEPSKGKCKCHSWSGWLLAHFHKYGLIDLHGLTTSLKKGFSLGL